MPRFKKGDRVALSIYSDFYYQCLDIDTKKPMLGRVSVLRENTFFVYTVIWKDGSSNNYQEVDIVAPGEEDRKDRLDDRRIEITSKKLLSYLRTKSESSGESITRILLKEIGLFEARKIEKVKPAIRRLDIDD